EDASSQPPVTMADREEAIARLRALAPSVELDRYLADIDPKRLLESRIGPTDECITFNDLEEYTVRQRPLGSTAVHLATCEECTEALKLYQRVQDRSLREERNRVPQVSVRRTKAIALHPGIVAFDLELVSSGAEDLAGVYVSSPLFDH